QYKQYIEQLGLTEAVNIVGYVEHSVCTKLLAESDVLWMMINKSERSDLHSTGKLYEYFGANKPILACVPEGVARRSLDMHGAVILTEPDDAQAIADAILSYYEMFKTGSMPVPNEQVTGMYDRKRLAGKLANEFNLLHKNEEVNA
ncbi:MAG TPA: glycosyl transferase family 1, partial [Bacteroidetes bacterium]|nr:glycosyl transferase family 1 [Bacteroidota bacterium]